MNTIKHYDAYIIFAPISAQERDQILQIFASQGLDIEVSETSLEFNFEGRDLDNRIPQCFVKIAAILRSADGELRCEIDVEEQDPVFEFFTIYNSQLWKETGRILRSEDRQLVS
jgi:hypothetical protein